MRPLKAARLVALSLSGYVVLWMLTAAVGVPQVKEAVLNDMKRSSGPATGEPLAVARSPVPLLVTVHYGDRSMDALEWHLWVFGAHGRVRTVWFHVL
jgi:hypothetical protein